MNYLYLFKFFIKTKIIYYEQQHSVIKRKELKTFKIKGIVSFNHSCVHITIICVHISIISIMKIIFSL